VSEIPQVPLVLDGWAVLHQWYRLRWADWRARGADVRARIAAEAGQALAAWEARDDGQSAAFALLGHKGDLMLVHFRRDLPALLQAQLEVSRWPLSEFLEPTGSYLSVVELGLYGASVKAYKELAAQGHAPGSEAWSVGVAAEVERQRGHGAPRLHGAIPGRRYCCFYPMDKKREGDDNWYRLPIEERARLMTEHGAVGRRYAGRVTQVISGSIGLDDWEWGVDLFADDPLVFKQLVAEMRFDEASARYAAFGTFVVGLRCPGAELAAFLDGRVPAYAPPPVPRGPSGQPS
jgi:chlorite dismutase